MPATRRRRRRRAPLAARIQRSSTLWWLTTVAGALALALAVSSALSATAAVRDRFGPLRPAVVVAAPVAVGAVVPAGALHLERRPRRLIPHGAVTATGAGAGRTATAALVPGEVLVESRLAPTGLTGPAALLPPGTRAVAVPGGPGGRPPMRVGDHVDVLATGAGAAADAAPTVSVAEAALVVDVDTSADTVTIAVPVGDLPAVAYAISTATITLALTSP